MSNTTGISKWNVLDILGLPGASISNPPVGVARLFYNITTDEVIAIDSTGSQILGGSGGSPGGSSGDIQYNNGTTFAGDAKLFWDHTDGRLGVGLNTPLKVFTVQVNAGGAIGFDWDGFEPHIYSMDPTFTTYKALVLDASTVVLADEGTAVVQQLHGGPLYVNNGLVVSTAIGTGTAAQGVCNAVNGFQVGATAGVSVGPFTSITSITTTGGLVTSLSGSSDEALKSDIREFQRGLEAITKIEPARYFWNRDGQKQTGLSMLQEFVGFIAQNVREAIPEAVGEEKSQFDDRMFLTLSDRVILATLVNAVKELAVRLAGIETIVNG